MAGDSRIEEDKRSTSRSEKKRNTRYDAEYSAPGPSKKRKAELSWIKDGYKQLKLREGDHKKFSPLDKEISETIPQLDGTHFNEHGIPQLKQSMDYKICTLDMNFHFAVTKGNITHKWKEGDEKWIKLSNPKEITEIIRHKIQRENKAKEVYNDLT